MDNLTKDELVMCASVILDRPDVTEDLLGLCSKLLRLASAMPETSEATEGLLKELLGMLNPA